MAPHKDAVRARRPRAAAGLRPLTEHQLADVRRAVLSLRGSGARSVKVHGLVVWPPIGHVKFGEILFRPEERAEASGPEGDGECLSS